jgi:hypothetical protein
MTGLSINQPAIPALASKQRAHVLSAKPSPQNQIEHIVRAGWLPAADAWPGDNAAGARPIYHYDGVRGVANFTQ